MTNVLLSCYYNLQQDCKEVVSQLFLHNILLKLEINSETNPTHGADFFSVLLLTMVLTEVVL